jgi:hypothetical protein
VGVRDTDAWILSLSYNITLRGRIVFAKSPVTLFKSNFETTAAGQPPNTTQAVGTAKFNGPNVVVSPPFLHTGNWLQIGPLTAAGGMFTGEFIQSPTGFGVYNFSAMMFMSSKPRSAESYLTFNSGSETNPAFLTLLFADNNQVQDGGLNPTGCTFPRDQPFAIQITLTITATSATAQIGVAGTVANQTMHLSPSLFTSVSFAQQNPGPGGFDVTDIVVTYTPQ